MIAIKLIEGTVIYSKKWTLNNASISVSGIKFVNREGEVVKLDDNHTIGMDAVETFAILHKGETYGKD